MITLRQLTFDDAARLSETARRDAGIAQAEGANPALWRAYAYAKLRALAEQRATVHVDDLYAVLEWHPTSPNAMGGLWLQAIREGLIERTGEYRATRLPGKHSHVYPVYRSLVWQGRANAAVRHDNKHEGVTA